MKQGLWHRLDYLARSLFPFLVTLFLAILSTVPFRLPEFSAIMPAMTLIAVFYWLVHKPQLLPVWAVGTIGLLQDLLSGGPPGVSIVVFLLLQVVVDRQRKLFLSASFVLIWAVFMALAAAALALAWGLTCLASTAYFDPRPIFFQYLLTIAVYPCFAWIMIQGQRIFEA